MRNPYIEQERRWRVILRERTASCYAAFVLALVDKGLVNTEDEGRMFEDIVDILSLTQDYVSDGVSVIQKCADKTGINMMSEGTAKTLDLREEGTRI